MDYDPFDPNTVGMGDEQDEREDSRLDPDEHYDREAGWYVGWKGPEA